MTLEELKNYCLSLNGCTIDFPFDADTMVFRVANKMFLLTDISKENLSINVKCDPQLAIILREEYKSCIPGYHMNKTHWNTIILNEEIDDDKVKEFILHSYALIYNSLPKKLRISLDLHI